MAAAQQENRPANAKAIQFHISVFPRFNLPRTNAFAIAERGWRRKFAWTTIVAIACLKEVRLDVPFDFFAH